MLWTKGYIIKHVRYEGKVPECMKRIIPLVSKWAITGKEFLSGDTEQLYKHMMQRLFQIDITLPYVPSKNCRGTWEKIE